MKPLSFLLIVILIMSGLQSRSQTCRDLNYYQYVLIETHEKIEENMDMIIAGVLQKSKIPLIWSQLEIEEKAVDRNGLLICKYEVREGFISRSCTLSFINSSGEVIFKSIGSSILFGVTACEEALKPFQRYTYRYSDYLAKKRGKGNDLKNNRDDKVSEEDLVDVDHNIPFNPEWKLNKYAFVIGNEEYAFYSPGNTFKTNAIYALNDARVFAKYCWMTLEVPINHVDTLYNGTAAQMNEFIQRIRNTIRNSNGEADVIIYYAGHGFADAITRIPYLVPVDVGLNNLDKAINLDEFYFNLTECKSQQILVFIDACMNFITPKTSMLASRGLKIIPKNDDTLKKNITIFTSCEIGEMAYPMKDFEHGIFTYSILKYINENRIINRGCNYKSYPYLY